MVHNLLPQCNSVALIDILRQPGAIIMAQYRSSKSAKIIRYGFTHWFTLIWQAGGDRFLWTSRQRHTVGIIIYNNIRHSIGNNTELKKIKLICTSIIS